MHGSQTCQTCSCRMSQVFLGTESCTHLFDSSTFLHYLLKFCLFVCSFYFSWYCYCCLLLVCLFVYFLGEMSMLKKNTIEHCHLHKSQTTFNFILILTSWSNFSIFWFRFLFTMARGSYHFNNTSCKQVTMFQWRNCCLKHLFVYCRAVPKGTQFTTNLL